MPSQEDVLIQEAESLEENKHRVEDDEDTYTKEDIISLAQNYE